MLGHIALATLTVLAVIATDLRTSVLARILERARSQMW